MKISTGPYAARIERGGSSRRRCRIDHGGRRDNSAWRLVQVSERRRDRESEFRGSARREGRLALDVLLARASTEGKVERELVVAARLQLRARLSGQHRRGRSAR